jgi:hypothetical protein
MIVSAVNGHNCVCGEWSHARSTAMIVTAKQLIENPRDMGPHVVLLGAGASLASFPHGDAHGKPLPLMDDLVKTLGLQPLLDEAGPAMGSERNFEAI